MYCIAAERVIESLCVVGCRLSVVGRRTSLSFDVLEGDGGGAGWVESRVG